VSPQGKFVDAPPLNYGQENLQSLPIKLGDLQPAPPTFGEKDEYPKFTRELIQLQWRSGDPIDLYVIKPHAVSKPPAILYLYSYPSETDRFRDNEYCERLTSNGYAAIGFVSALTGHRYHGRPMREWFVSQLPEALTESVHDVQMIINYLASRGDLNMDYIGMFGQGSGATIAILAASVDPRIRGLDAIQPWGDWAKWLAESSLVPDAERANYLKPDFLGQVAALDPVEQLPLVKTKAVRLQFVMDDSITPAVAIQGMKLAVPSRDQVVEYETKREQYNALAGGRAFDWIKQQLRVPEERSGGEKLAATAPKAQATDHRQ
jgi:dienelactone hydrolase